MINFLLMLLIVIGTFPKQTFSQGISDKEKVNTVVSTLFDGMRSSDGSTIRSVITSDATLHTVTESGDDIYLNPTPMGRFIESVESAEPGSLDERVDSVTIHTDGMLATAWVEYTFIYNGEFSHCGVNSINLIRKQDGWKIFSITDTRRQEGCEEKPE